MNVIDYIVQNYDSLPESTFDGVPCVIFYCKTDDEMGYGHHIYEAYGVNRGGEVLWCYSSGCSCNGTCGTNHESSTKVFTTTNFNADSFDTASVNFASLEKHLDSY